MTQLSPRRSTRAIGVAVALAGLVAGAALYVVSVRRPADNVAGFARAPVGCTTTLEFVDRGTFYVYAERGSGDDDIPVGCAPVAETDRSFDVAFTGEPQPVAVTDGGAGPSYDVDGFDGRAVRTVEIVEPGEYLVEVAGDDVAVVAAIGGDPQDGVQQLRLLALLVALVGVLVAMALLVRARRRGPSPGATPVGGPGTNAAASWAPPTTAPARPWPPSAPTIEVPVDDR